MTRTLDLKQDTRPRQNEVRSDQMSVMDVGTGSQFDILWDQKEVRSDQVSGMDVYNFLHMVNSAGGTNSNIACLGEEVDDLIEVDEVTNCLLLKDS